MTIKLYRTLPAAELVPTIAGFDDKKAVFSLPLDDLVAGDILIATGKCECTNDNPYPVRFSSQLLITTAQFAIGGWSLSPMSCFNISPDMHHGTAVETGQLLVPSPIAKAWATFIIWTNAAQAGNAKQENAKAFLTVQKSNGYLAVTKIRQP